MVTILFTILHVVVSLFLILVVLAQQGKGQDLASAFGGGGSQTAFGARGTATLLSKITAGAAILFMVTSLTLSYLRPAVSTDTVIPESAPAAAPEVPSEGEGEAEAEAEAETEAEGKAKERTPSDSDESSESGESQGQSEGEGGDPPPEPPR
jgi:preprotein translocase subunit SecG